MLENNPPISHFPAATNKSYAAWLCCDDFCLIFWRISRGGAEDRIDAEEEGGKGLLENAMLMA